MIRSVIEKYIFDIIVPRYSSFDAAHKEDHALCVINHALALADAKDGWLAKNPDAKAEWDTDINMEILLAAAACHDLGLINGRERHHLDSGEIIRNDTELKKWFSEDEIETIAQAAEDHRASGTGAPRSIYGMIVAEADRIIESGTIIRRTIQFGLRNYPDLAKDEQIDRAAHHLQEKYGRGGYLRLWIPWSDNAVRLNDLQELISDSSRLYSEIERIYQTL